MLPVDDVANEMVGKGFENIMVMKGGSFKPAKTVVICPTRGMIHHRVAQSHQQLMSPMNQARTLLYVAGDEVGDAYNSAINMVLHHPVYSTWDYIMTVEDDNILPVDAHIRLLEAMEECPGADAVSGIYFTKSEFSMPMAYGDPVEFLMTGKISFRPRTPEEVGEALKKGYCMEVNGIAMGCALWKMDLMRYVPPPWFVTVSDIVKDTDGNTIGPMSYTQDLKFCERAKRMGKRFYVDFRCKVGHLDVNTGEVY